MGSGGSDSGFPLLGPGFYVADARPVARKYANLFTRMYPEARPVVYEYKVPRATLDRTMHADVGQIPQGAASMALKDLQRLLHMSGDEALAWESPFGTAGKSGMDVLKKLYARLGSPKEAAKALSDVGIIGNKYGQNDVPSLHLEAVRNGALLPQNKQKFAEDILGGKNYAIWDQPTLDEMAHSAKMEYYKDPLTYQNVRGPGPWDRPFGRRPG